MIMMMIMMMMMTMMIMIMMILSSDTVLTAAHCRLGLGIVGNTVLPLALQVFKYPKLLVNQQEFFSRLLLGNMMYQRVMEQNRY